MEPRIQYAKTSDGGNIAFAESGSGPPLLFLPPTPSHLVLDWRFDEFLGRYQWLGRRFTLIRLDVRNTGLSQRGVENLDYVADIDAVVQRLSIERFTLFSIGSSSRAAIAYAAAYPERLQRLVLWQAYAATEDITGDPRVAGLLSLVDGDWEMFTESYASLVGGWESGEHVRRYAALLREATTQEDMKRVAERGLLFDDSGLLPSISCPTLVVNLPQSIVPMKAAQRVAAAIPNAQLQLVEGRSVFVRFDSPTVEPWLEAFLSGEDSNPPAVEVPSGTAVILFADIAESTALTERHGDAAFREKARDLDAALRRAITSNGGTAIEGKLLGDGVLAVFGAAREAIACASACHAAANSAGLALHAGIHAGDVIREANNVYGGAVNIAARVADAAAAGETLVSQTVRDLARTSAGVAFEDRGERALKGVSEPVRVYAVRERG